MKTITGSGGSALRRTICGMVCGFIGMNLLAAAAEAEEAVVAGAFDCRVIEERLTAPDGLARHPATGRIFVTEEDRNRVVLIGGESRKTVIDDVTPVFAPNGAAGAPLRSPEGLCVRSDGALYVAEDYPGGRLICFRIGADGRADFGRQVEVPGYLADFAWEAVACSPDGRLLLAGSNAEAWSAGEEGPALFMSVLLYRDEQKHWWRLLGEPAVSLSSVSFSPDGKRAVYACEIHGFVGWMDLGDKDTRQRIGPETMNSPESLAVMEDGRVLVAEEKGTLAVLAASGEVQTRLDLGHGDIETVVWDGASRTAWVTCDGEGSLLQVTCAALRQDAPLPPIEKIRMRSPWSPRYVPQECPSFMDRIFADVRQKTGATNDFPSLAWKVPMVAMHLDLDVQSGSQVDDPYLDLTLIVVHPNQVGMKSANGAETTCLFVARRKSGKIVRSDSKDVKAVLFAVSQAKATDEWNSKLSLPVPAAVRVSAEGVANIHMIGLGRTPDFNIVLNPAKPEESYVLVAYVNGGTTYYKLTAECAAKARERMVISYSERLGRMWMDLGLAKHNDSMELDPRTTERNRMVAVDESSGS